MKNDKERLMVMLNENKISQDDYNTLLVALEKKSFFLKLQSSLWLNPFQKIAGFKALIMGMMILLAMSGMGVIAKVYFVGSISIINASAVAKQTMDISFLLLAYQNIVSWLILSAMFILAAMILQKKKIRIIDFLGTVSLARFPALLITILIGIVRMINPSILDVDMSKGISLHASFSQTLLGVLMMVLIVWQIFTYFYAFKESSGLIGKKLVLGFIASIIAAEYSGLPLTTMLTLTLRHPLSCVCYQ